MEDILKQLFKKISADMEEDKKNRMKIEVGKMDDELFQQHKFVYREKRRLRDEMKLKAAELQMKYEREMEEVLEPLNDRMNDLHDEFWNRIYAKFNLDSNEEFEVDVEEKKIYQYLDIPEADNRFKI